MAAILGYVVIVLSAMQVGLGTERLASDEAFQAVSWGFTVFSMIAPLIGVAAIFIFVFFFALSNWLATTRYEEKRFRKMHVERFWRTQEFRSLTKPEGSSPFVNGRETDC